MKLVLDLIGPPRLMGARNRCELRSGSLTIGRSPEADWVIPDMDRLISRRHLRIDSSNGDFVLTDMSSNGVYVNASDMPVGYGASVKLQDGDGLRVGEAQIAVAIQSAEVDPSAPKLDPLGDARIPPSRVTNGVRDPLGGPFGQSSSSDIPAASPVADPLTAAPKQVIDANWMIQPGSVSAPQPLSQGRDRTEVLPIPASSQAAPAREAPSGLQAPPSLLALVEQHPGLSARRLAEAVDAATRTMEASEWQALRHKINLLVE